MSRAPAPKLVTETPVAHHPYGNTAAYPMMHPMQNVYTNMQLQQQLQPQQMPLTQQQMPFETPHNGYGGFYTNAHSVQPPGSTMQNVSVVDFKPDVLAQHQMNQLQHQYQANSNAMGIPVVPTMGLVGPDGRYQPVTAAATSYGRQEDYNSLSEQAERYTQRGRRMERFNRDTTGDYPGQDPYENIEDMINRSVDKRFKASRSPHGLDRPPLHSIREHDANAYAKSFKCKSQEQQREIVAAAVNEVRKKYDVKRETPSAATHKNIGTNQRYTHSFDDY